MIAYEIQLRYVIRDKIQSETNSVRDKIGENIIAEKFCRKKNSQIFFLDWILSLTLSQTEFVLDFQCAFLFVSDTSMLIITKWYIHTAISLKHLHSKVAEYILFLDLDGWW